MYLSLLLLYMYIHVYINTYIMIVLINLFKSIFLFLSKCHNVTNLFTYFSLWAGGEREREREREREDKFHQTWAQ